MQIDQEQRLMIQIVPFDDSYLASAAELLANRHTLDRQRISYLPKNYTHVRFTEQLLSQALAAQQSSGFAAFQNSQLVGFCISEQIDFPPDSTVAPYYRPKSILVRYHSHAALSGSETRIYQELYGVAARQWVGEGFFSHYIQIPAGNDELHGLFTALGFGRNLGWAMRDIGGFNEPSQTKPPLNIRRADQTDLEAVIRLNAALERYESQSPVFLPIPTPVAQDEIRAEVNESLENPNVWRLLAEDQGRPVGLMTLTTPPAHVSPLLTPDNTINVAGVSVLPSERGRGVATLLLNHGLNAALTEGFRYCRMSWMTANPLSSRYWTRRGFNPIAWQLSRSVDDRVEI